jgi:hypothetical protein
VRKTQIAICTAATLGLCLVGPQGASAFPAADGFGTVHAQTITDKNAVTLVRWAGRAGGWGRGVGWRGAGWRGGWRRGYYGGWGGLGLGVGLGDNGYGGYGGYGVRFVPPGTAFCTHGWSWYGNSPDYACGYW